MSPTRVGPTDKLTLWLPTQALENSGRELARLCACSSAREAFPCFWR
jgi:hypothetical protein